MLYQLKPLSDPKLKKTYQQAIKDLNAFFEIGWKHHLPPVFLVPSRQTINNLKGKITPEWMVGWTTLTPPAVYLLDKDSFEQESNHSYSPKTYAALLKHELTHCFYYAITNNYTKPLWLKEGIAIHLSGQLKEKNKPEKLTDFLDYYEKQGKKIYSQSGWAIKALLDNFPKDNFLKLLEKIKETKPEKEEFNQIFTKIYFKPTYSNFNQYLD